MQDQLRKILAKVKPGGKVIATSFHENAFLPQVEIFLNRIQDYRVQTSPPVWRLIGTQEKCAAFFESAGLIDVQSYRKDLSYYLKDAGEWWDFIWYAGYRGLVSQLSPECLAEFKHNHLKEIQDLASDRGIKLAVDVLYTVGAKPQTP
jgi:hypothetical protein